MVDEFEARQKDPRNRAFWLIINQLNEQGRHHENCVFDCGKLGFVRIWFEGGYWEHKWLEVSTEFKKQIENRR